MGFFCYGSDVLLQVGVASSRGVPGGLRFERMLRSGGSVIVPKEVSNSKASRKGVQVHP